MQRVVAIPKSYGFEESVGMILVKWLVRPHERHKVLGLREVDDVVRISRQHVDSLQTVARHFEFQYIVCPYLSLLNESMPRHDNEQFPLSSFNRPLF